MRAKEEDASLFVITTFTRRTGNILREHRSTSTDRNNMETSNRNRRSSDRYKIPATRKLPRTNTKIM